MSDAGIAAEKRRRTKRLAGGALAALLLVVGLGYVLVSGNDTTSTERGIETAADSDALATSVPPSDSGAPIAGTAESSTSAPAVSVTELSTSVPAGSAVESSTSEPASSVPASTTSMPATSVPSSTTSIPATSTPPSDESIEIADVRDIDWRSELRQTSEIDLSVDGAVATNGYDYYEVYDGGGHALTDDVIYGDIDGDGVDDAIVPLDSGGTARGTGGLVFLATNEGAELIGGAEFYNSFGYKAWPSIENGNVVIKSVVGAGWEANCCFSGTASTTWQLMDGVLIQTEYAEVGIPEMRAATIERFYGLVNEGRFETAYEFLSRAQQAAQPFGEWKSGFNDTVETTATAGVHRGNNRFDVEIVAVDSVPEGGSTKTTFAGTWDVEWSNERHQWLLDSPAIRETSSVVTPADPPPTAESASFVTPSGNISCVVGVGASCFIAEKEWEIDEPADCDGDYGNSVFVSADGADFGCYTDLWWDLDAETAPYGSTVSAGSYRCLIKTSGVTCTNASGGGFTVSRAEVDLFD